jgi:hypothetical protein
LTIYLDRFEDNAPITDATITVLADGEQVSAEASPEGTYVATSNRFATPGSLELVFDIRAPAADDLLIGKLFLPNPSSSTDGVSVPALLYGRVSSALRHGTEDHLALLVLTLCTGLVVGFASGQLRPRALPLILVAPALFFCSTGDLANAHENHDQSVDGVPAPGSDLARRLPGGRIFVPKPTQRILDIRTATAKTETQPKAIVLVGRVIANPNRSGLVQSISGGRVTAPDHGFPRLGQRVAKGEVLASVEPPMEIADRTQFRSALANWNNSSPCRRQS